MAKELNSALQAKAAKVAGALEGNFFSFKEGVTYKVVDIKEAKDNKPAVYILEFNGIRKTVEARYLLPFVMKEEFTDFSTDRVWPTDNEGSIVDSVAHPVLLNKDGFTVSFEEGEFVSIKKLAAEDEDCEGMVTVGENRYRCRPAKKTTFTYA